MDSWVLRLVSTALESYGLVNEEGGGSAAGIHGISHGPHSNGVIGRADNGSSAYGVWGQSTSGYAGVFSGKVDIRGNLFKSSGGFKIDHPLDPENSYLSHSFVESPDMLNVYCGTIETDNSGEALVTLPSYFEELNQNFTYQLTVIGAFARAIVVDEIRDNQFSVKTDEPNVKVSWQVTGVRKDPFAAGNRIIVEEEKPEEQRGKYLHPEAYGRARSLSIDFEREQELDQRLPKPSERAES